MFLYLCRENAIETITYPCSFLKAVYISIRLKSTSSVNDKLINSFSLEIICKNNIIITVFYASFAHITSTSVERTLHDSILMLHGCCLASTEYLRNVMWVNIHIGEITLHCDCGITSKNVSLRLLTQTSIEQYANTSFAYRYNLENT